MLPIAFFSRLILSKFNQPSSTVTKTENYAGGEAFVETPKLEFASILLTSFVSNQFYRSENETLDKVIELMSKVDPLFAAKTAVYARTKYGMRSISHVVAAELVKLVKGQDWTKRFVAKVVYRPDDMSEILAYYLNKYKKPIPNSLKKGLALAFNKFDEYQLAKYRGDGQAVSLIDIINLVRPKPSNSNSEALKKLVEGTLRSTGTWETKMTELGKQAKKEGVEFATLKTKGWEDMIDSWIVLNETEEKELKIKCNI